MNGIAYSKRGFIYGHDVPTFNPFDIFQDIERVTKKYLQQEETE